MPWSKVRGDSRCPTSRPWAVVKDGDNELEGCHATEEDANDQLAALNAAEADEELAELAQEVVGLTTRTMDLNQLTVTGPDQRLGGKPNPGTKPDRRLRRNRQPRAQSECPPGQHQMPDGTCMDDDEMSLEGPLRPWSGVLAVEGVETGDGREFAAGSLEWPDLDEVVVPLSWQREAEPQHMRSVVVGRIQRIEREGSLIRGWGVIKADAEVTADLEHGLAGGVSVDVDSVKDSDVELVFPDPEEDDESVEEDDEGNILMLFGPPPEKVVFHRGRLRGATLVALPAFVEAHIALDDLTGEADLVASLLTRRERLGAVGSHDTGTSDGAWDGGAQELRLPTPMPVTTARNMYAWMADGAVEDGEVRKNDLKFPHHEVGSNDQPGSANLTACSSGIGVLNGGRGGTTIPAGDRQGVYDHLAAHLRDAGREPPALADLDDALVAAGAVAIAPPVTWFRDPVLGGPTPFTVDDDGRVRGHLALWGVCHTTFADQCVTPPRERDYPYFQLGELRTREGESLGVGSITLGTGHFAGLGAAPAVEHYDHTGTVAADVACGEDRYGIWVAGALRPGLSEARVRELRAAKLSGDWRKIGGRLRLVAVLAVNVPGFPVPRMRARMDGEGLLSLVAAGVVTDERQEAYGRVRGDGYGTLRVRKVVK